MRDVIRRDYIPFFLHKSHCKVKKKQKRTIDYFYSYFRIYYIFQQKIRKDEKEDIFNGFTHAYIKCLHEQ